MSSPHIRASFSGRFSTPTPRNQIQTRQVSADALKHIISLTKNQELIKKLF